MSADGVSVLQAGTPVACYVELRIVRLVVANSAVLAETRFVEHKNKSVQRIVKNLFLDLCMSSWLGSSSK